MKIKQMDPASLTPYEGNPRKISEAAVEAVSRSIESAGFRQPVVIDEDGVIIIGHARTQAAIALGLKKVPVHVAEDLTPGQVKALRLNDNRTSENASWDQMLLGMEVGELAASDFDLDGLAFSNAEIERLLDAADDFEPITDPKTGTTEWTPEDLDGAEDDKNKFGERSKQVLVEVTCPECDAEFFLQPEDMKT